jgi:M6 family metalloprotease-like protein
MKKVLLFVFLIQSITLFSAPYNGKLMQFQQPDGSFVDVKLYGTEYYMRAEGLDDFTLIRDKSTGWICYAGLSADGSELLSTKTIYRGKKDDISTLKTDLTIAKHIDISDGARESFIRGRRQVLDGKRSASFDKTNPHPVSGHIRGLCIVVDFSDEVGIVPMSEFDHFCNDIAYTGYGNNGSLRTYYSDISGGIVDYENVVYGYYRAPLTFAAYENMTFPQGAQQVLGLALNWVESTGFDFSTLSINPDGSIMAINLMYTGVAQTWSEGMWWHQGYYSGFAADGVHSGNYNCSPAYSPLTIATICHENGHMIGNWPDTYKYNNTTGPDGIGAFDLMCSIGYENNPVPPNPHFWSNAGWGKVVDVTDSNNVNSDTANSRTCYKYLNRNDTNEFFLIENRRKTGRSAALPDEGLTIWHIDRNGNNQSNHHEVYLVHANNNIQDHSSACFHDGFNNEYGGATTPNSHLFNGDPSGLRVWDISNVANVMSYKLGAGQPSPVLFLSYLGFSGDDNENGFFEPGESADFRINASNYGQLLAENITITCAPIGSNADYVTVNNSEVHIDTLDISQTVEVTYNVEIAPATPIGTEIELRFNISDGSHTAFTTKSIIIGDQIIIGNQELTTCAAIFLDNGGDQFNYSDMTDYTATILPSSSDQRVKVEFLTFGLEADAACGYDYLSIYDGPSIASNLIRTYCGSRLPKSVTSTDPTGALTFVFHSDEYVNDIGWSAIISCADPVGLRNDEDHIKFGISPNPLTDIATIQLDPDIAHTMHIVIVDICGTPVMKYPKLNQSGIELSRDNFNKGIYFVQLWQDKQILETKKLIVL